MIHRGIDHPVSQQELLAYAPMHVAAGAVVLDLGACVGAYSRQCVEAGATVIAVEPDPANYAELCHNVPEALKLNLAVGKEHGFAQLQRGPVNNAHWLGTGTSGKRVRTVDLAWLLALRPDLIKCDIEGSEWDLDFSQLTGVRELAIEFHDESKHTDTIRPALMLQKFKMMAATHMPPNECRVEVWAR